MRSRKGSILGEKDEKNGVVWIGCFIATLPNEDIFTKI